MLIKVQCQHKGYFSLEETSFVFCSDHYPHYFSRHIADFLQHFKATLWKNVLLFVFTTSCRDSILVSRLHALVWVVFRHSYISKSYISSRLCLTLPGLSWMLYEWSWWELDCYDEVLGANNLDLSIPFKTGLSSAERAVFADQCVTN